MSNTPNKANGTKQAVAHKKNILDDRRIRLALSILLAVIAWMVVTIIVQPGTTNTIYNVPVDYSYDSAAYTSRGLSIVSAEDKTVNLKISGDGYTIGGLTASDFVVYPDFSSVRDSGEKNLRLLVRGANGLLNGVTVTMGRVESWSIFAVGPATLSSLRLRAYTSTESSKSFGALMKFTFTGRVAIL